MAALMTLERDIFAAALNDDVKLKALVEGRIIWNFAIRGVNPKYPYVLFNFEYGGYTEETQGEDSDSYWRICGVTDDYDQIDPFLSHIERVLHREEPRNPNLDKCSFVTWIETEEPWVRWNTSQGSTVWEAGGIYRIRLNLACKEDRYG